MLEFLLGWVGGDLDLLGVEGEADALALVVLGAGRRFRAGDGLNVARLGLLVEGD